MAADDGVDAVLAAAVPTAFSDVSAAVAEAVISKPPAVAFPDRASWCGGSSVGPSRRRCPARMRAPAGRRLSSTAAAAVTGAPGYADPVMRPRALGHAVRYRAWRGRSAASPSWLGRARMTRAPRRRVPGRSPDGGGCRNPARPSGRPVGRPAGAHRGGAAEEEAAAAAAQLGGRVALKAEAEGLCTGPAPGASGSICGAPQEVAEGYRTLAATSGRG